MSLQDFWREADDVLSLVIVNEVQVLQRGDGIVFANAGPFADLTAHGTEADILTGTGSVAACRYTHSLRSYTQMFHPLDGDGGYATILRPQAHQDLQDGVRPIAAVG